MKRVLITILVIIVIVFSIVGCKSDKLKSTLKSNISKPIFNVIKNNKSFIQAQISFENQSKYQFVPTFVGIRESHKITPTAIDTENTYDLLIEGNRNYNQYNKNKYLYTLIIPNKQYIIFKNSDQQNISIDIRGYFIDKDKRVIFGLDHGYGISLDKYINTEKNKT